MENELKEDLRAAIKTLLKAGRSQLWISRELGMHRLTVKRYAKELKGSKCTIGGESGLPPRFADRESGPSEPLRSPPASD